MSNRDTVRIWRWERHFQILAESRAKKLLGGLDPRLAPTVHLIGLRPEETEGESQSYEVNLVPPDSELADGDFTHLPALATRQLEVDPERQLRHSHPVAQQNAEEALRRRALTQAVTEVLKPLDLRDGLLSFCGDPVEVTDWGRTHLVIPVVRVDAAAFQAHAVLTRDWYEIHEFRRARIATSLVDAAILELLRALGERLRVVNPGADMQPTEATPDELLHRAGRRLMQTAEVAAEPLAVESLWAACDAVATMPYEGKEARGRLVIAPSSAAAVEMRLDFDPPIDVGVHRTFRKLLELTSSLGAGLVTDGLVLRGLGAIGADYDVAAEECFTVDFLGNGTWELRHSEHPLMVVRYGRPAVPKPRISREQLAHAMQRVGGAMGPEAEERLWDAVTAMMQTGHGSLLVVSSEADTEATRFQPQVIPVRRTPLDADLGRRGTAIDGAVLVDLDGMCHALGAILDGPATGDGDASRGSRLNSAVRYVDSRRGRCFALVVSEDGMADLVLPRGPRDDEDRGPLYNGQDSAAEARGGAAV